MTKQRTPQRRSTLDRDEMLGVVWRLANGETISQAVRPIRGATRAAFFRTLAKSPQWRTIIEKMKPDFAWAAVDDWREAARTCVEMNPGSPAAVTAYGKATLATAKALNPREFGERPDTAAPVAFNITTNLDFGIVRKFEEVQRQLGTEAACRAIEARAPALPHLDTPPAREDEDTAEPAQAEPWRR